MRVSCLGCVASVVLLLSTTFVAASPEVQPGRDFEGISYSMSTSGQVVVYAGLRNIKGKLAVCGLVFFEKKANATTRAAERQITDNIKFKIAGKSINVTPRSFTRYVTEQEADGGTAGCSVTTKAWQDAYSKAKLTMALSAGSFRF